MPSLLIPALNEFNWTINSISRNNLTFRYEPLQPLLLLEMLNDVHGDVFFDIGSNIGLYTIMMSTSESLQNIYSYEPAQDTYVELEANIKLNNLSNIATPYCLGVSSSDGTFNFQIESPLSGINSIVDTSFHNKDLFHEFTEIKTVALDNCHHLESKTLVFKIDVEGHEYEVLKGAKNLLSKNMCILQIEIMEKHLKNCQNILTSLGYYEIFKIKNDHYFTNISYKDRIINIFENASEKLINLLLGKWPNFKKIDLINYKINIENKKIMLNINVDSAIFRKCEFAFYIYMNKEIYKKVMYSPSSLIEIDLHNLPKDKKISVTAFARESNNHSIMSKKHIELSYD